MNLLQVCSRISPEQGGPVRVIEETSSRFELITNYTLLEFGATNSNNSKIQKNSHSDKIKLKSRMLPNYGFALGVFRKEIRKKIYNSDTVVIHGYYLFSSLITLLLSRKNTKLFLMPHGSFEKYHQERSRIRKYIFHNVFKSISRDKNLEFIVATAAECGGVQKAFPKNKVSVVGIGVNLPEIKNNTQLKRDISLVCVSRIDAKKRIDICIKSLELLNHESHNYFLNIAGSGNQKLREALVDLANDSKFRKNILFHGFLNGLELENFWRKAHIFILPSENENFAIAVAEAISFGVPVIVSKNVGMAEFVSQTGCGIVIDNLEPVELAQAIDDLIKDFESYQSSCIRSRYLLEWNSIFINWMNVFGLE